jgi:SNF2 family DNA or RNA helicase
MIKIEIDEEVLVLEVSDHPELLIGQYSFLLSRMGFTKDVNSKKYLIEDPIMVGEKIKEIITFFEKRGYAVEHCKKFDELTVFMQEETESFHSAKIEGLKVKNMEKYDDLIIPGFIRKLKDYQLAAVRHLLTVNHGANFSVPGSGKTTMLYAAFGYWRNLGEVEKLLVIGPLSSFMAWEDEYIGCFGTQPVSVRLIGSNRELKYHIDNADIYLISFQTASQDIDRLIELLKRYKFMVIIDESHYIKRIDNGRWASTALKLAPYAKKRAISTGTPMPNGLQDLYSQMTFLWPGKQILGEKQKYKSEIKRINDFEYFRERIDPFFYRIKKSDLNLPEPIVHYVNLDMSPIQKRIYKILAHSTLEEISGLTNQEIIEISQWRKAKVIRLMQCATNPALLSEFCDEFQVPPLHVDNVSIIDLIKNYPLFETPAKIIKAIELVEDLIKQGHKVLVWSTFIKNINVLKEAFDKLGIPVYLVFGQIPKDDNENEEFNREQQIRSFKNSVCPCVLLANPAACAESISLHKHCHHAIYLDRNFNCGQFLQSKDRIHRIGLEQTEETHYYFICSNNSIDEVIDLRLEEKARAMYEIIEGDLPIGIMNLDNEQWKNDNEQEEDFNAVRDHLRDVVRE